VAAPRSGISPPPPPQRGHPPPPPLPPHPRGPPPAVAFAVEHPVIFAESDAVDARDPPFGHFVQLMAADAVDAFVATDPEITTPVFQNLKDPVVVKAVLHPVVEKLAVAEAAQPVVISPDPERPFGVFIDRAHSISRQPVGCRVVGEFAIFELRQAAESSEPQRAAPVLMNDLYVIARQSVFGRIASDDLVPVES